MPVSYAARNVFPCKLLKLTKQTGAKSSGLFFYKTAVVEPVETTAL